MSKELAQSEGIEVPEISIKETPVNTSGATEGSSHLEDLSSFTPRIGNISTCLDILIFSAPLLALFSENDCRICYTSSNIRVYH